MDGIGDYSRNDGGGVVVAVMVVMRCRHCGHCTAKGESEAEYKFGVLHSFFPFVLQVCLCDRHLVLTI